MIWDLLCWGLIVATAIQILFWTIGVARLIRHKDASPKEVDLPVSLIICARNEAKNLGRHLSLWLRQAYDNYEVVIVDDDSADDSSSLLDAAEKEFPELLRVVRRIRTETDLPGKKAALRIGITTAKNPYLIFTDADCAPSSYNWLRRMVQPFDNRKELVLGYGPLYQRSGWVNRWSRYETLHTAITYFSSATWGVPYMGVGRNLAYAQRLAAQQGDNSINDDLPGGDDDLFVNSLPPDVRTGIVTSPEAWCWSEAPGSWKEWYGQKTRHLQTGVRYRFRDKLLLATQAFSHFLHYVLVIVLVWQFPLLALSCLVIRVAVFFVAALRLWPRFGQASLLPWFMLLDLLHVGYYLLFSPVIFGWKRSKKW